MTGPEFATALLWGAALICIVGTVLMIATAVADWLADQPESDPAKVAATRAELRDALIDHLRETEPDIDAELERRWRAGAAVRRGQDTPYTSPDPRLRIDADHQGWERLLRAVDGDGDVA